MKKMFFSLIFIGSVSTLFSQVTLTLEQYELLLNEKKNLEQCESRETALQNQIDSLTTVFQELNEQNRVLMAEKDTLRNDLKASKRKGDELAVANTEKLQAKEQLEKRLNQKRKELVELEKEKERSNQEQYIKGRQDVLNTLTTDYESLSFDEMIMASSQRQVNRDLGLVGDEQLKQKLQNLKKYFSGRDVLAQKFDFRNVQYALEVTKTIKNESSMLKELIENLENYKLRNDGLKETIQKLLFVDNRFIANTEKDEKEKEALILSQISWYFYNYDFKNFDDYPYLSSVIIQVMKEKHKDANSDISEILEQL